jgi:hypothetical protein
MNRRSWTILASLGVLCVASTAAKDRKAPELAPHLGAIGVTIQSKGPVAISAKPYAETAFFVRTDLGDDPFHAPEVLASSFSDKNQVYLLNATPGKYVIVGAYTPAFIGAGNMNDMPSTMIYFDKSTIQATETTVEEGKISFAGTIIVKVSADMKDADDAQRHYGHLLGTGTGWNVGVHASGPPGHIAPTADIGHLTRAGTLQSLDKNPEMERKFWTLAAEKVFKDAPDWQDLVRRRLESAP